MLDQRLERGRAAAEADVEVGSDEVETVGASAECALHLAVRVGDDGGGARVVRLSHDDVVADGSAVALADAGRDLLEPGDLDVAACRAGKEQERVRRSSYQLVQPQRGGAGRVHARVRKPLARVRVRQDRDGRVAAPKRRARRRSGYAGSPARAGRTSVRLRSLAPPRPPSSAR